MRLTCTRCNKTADRLIVEALMVTLGAVMHPSPEKCIDGGEHDLKAETQSGRGF